ncbi:SDR family oxidoreductase [Sedimentibacter hydroxybenzoicus DSM 7310]|uniref:SDR family oxidoreductase n=1 Tax=Sedimentibacter hydroxybenzoicus DSM 7310 TaxID=1123245 RepID=A0A974BKF3_SEDHY|nr:SDR family NAD(P)-dependent oxidoreductase [Sedimentibacter hydroxybenzoicus]NYB74939.1 SDR family oxidoreductase [Sedimentibacter hydroxybenzoicus DSM 7310]
MFDFNNKVAIVTGSGSKKGIGIATADMLARLGATVVICDLNQKDIDDNVKAIIESGGKALGLKLDVTDENSVNEMVDKVLSEYGHIDILVNVAGISQKITVEYMELEDMKRIFNVNMYGVFLCTKAVLKIMKKQKYGRIITVSSVAGKRGGGIFGGPHYSASKAAVLGFSKNLAREVAGEGITVNCVTPGLIETDIAKTLNEKEVGLLVKDIPMGRRGKTYEVAGAIAFLASDEASYITGEEIDINGGSHMD